MNQPANGSLVRLADFLRRSLEERSLVVRYFVRRRLSKSSEKKLGSGGRVPAFELAPGKKLDAVREWIVP